MARTTSLLRSISANTCSLSEVTAAVVAAVGSGCVCPTIGGVMSRKAAKTPTDLAKQLVTGPHNGALRKPHTTVAPRPGQERNLGCARRQKSIVAVWALC